MASRAGDRTLVLHIGLHKTATSYLQNVWSARRYDLLQEGILYPIAGTGSLARGVDRLQLTTRKGAQSGHAVFTRPVEARQALGDLLQELPETVGTVLLSSEDFSLGRVAPERYIELFSDFGTVKVVLVLRRQDFWIESYYKQVVDQYGNFETRSCPEYLRQEGATLLDFHARFSPWRDLVGPENFTVLSYDDMAGGEAICRRILELAGLRGPLLDEAGSIPVPRYESIRGIDTVGLRILNGYHLADRDERTRTAQRIYAVAPAGDLELLTPAMRQAIVETYAEVNARIESEWFDQPVPGFRFASTAARSIKAPETAELLDYVDRVLELCEAARPVTDAGTSA